MYKKVIVFLMGYTIIFQAITSFAYDTSPDFIHKKHFEFASQYEYHEGDIEKSFEEYPDVIYTTGTETATDGTIFECPAIYIEWHAMSLGSFNQEQKNVVFKINGSEKPSYSRCVLFNDRLLVPAEVFGEVGCNMNFDENTYVTTIAKDGTILEILPNLIGMRKIRRMDFMFRLKFVQGL